ncbi:MAG: hypothetical protein II852_08300 [Bacteroidales bacterium]|nr:hypothetical protein [Bacteroidales bacterium]
MMQSNFSVIESKLDDFVRKFYSNRIVVGVLLLLLVAAVSLFSVFMIESFAFMTPIVKTILFYFLLFVFAAVFVFFIGIPLCKLLKLIPYISYEEAAGIISEFFSDSSDMLLNVIQLNRGESNDFLVAAINQKIEKISPWNFTHAINFQKTWKFLYVSGGILAFLLLMSYFFRAKMSSGASRFMNYSVYYQPDNPYTVRLLNDSLKCANGDDFTVLLAVDGPSSPQDVYVKTSVVNARMNVDSANHYSYTFRNLTADVDFSFGYLGYQTDDFTVSVFQKPQVLGVTVTVTPPAYTQIKGDEFENTGDFTVPFGSQISWKFDVANCQGFNFYADTALVESKIDGEKVVTNRKALKSFDYRYDATGDNGFKYSSNLFHVNIVPDYYPQIQVVSAVDSTTANAVFFSGHIADDYGFHSLTFNYYDTKSPQNIKSQPIDVAQAVSQDFYFYFDFSNLPKSVSYYFEVRDNDAVSGFKAAKTPISVYTTITNEEKQERVDNLNTSISDKVDQAKRILNELTNDLNDFQKSISANDMISDWEKQLKLNNLMEKQNRLQQLMQELSQENSSKNAFENQLSPEMSEDLMEKQRQLQELWDNLLTDDIKELLDKINEMKNSLNEKSLRDNISDLKFDFDQINEQLERNSELMKMYNVDNKLQKLTQDLNDLAEDLRDISRENMQQSDKSNTNLSDKNADKDSKSDKNNANKSDKNADNKSKIDQNSDTDNQDLAQKMEDLLNQFSEKFKDYNDLMRLNEELGDNKLQINDVQSQFEDLKRNLQHQQNELNDLENKPNKSDNNAQNGDKFDSQNQKNDANNDNNDAQKSDSLQSVSQETNTQKQVSQKSDTQKQDSQRSDSQKTDSNKNQNQQNDNQNQNSRQRREQLSQQMDESSEQMEDLADQMQGLQMQNQQKKYQENINDIRQILDNLLTISFNQESLINQLKSNTQIVYLSTDFLRAENSIQMDFALVKDSIYVLAKRVPELGHAVYEKIDDINSNFNKIFSGINNNSRSSVMSSQQQLLTNVNDLALIFNEIADQMQNQQNQQGNQSQQEQEESTSRNKKEMQQRQENTQQMKNQQQSLKQHLQNMLQQLQEGGKPSSQQLAESLKMQEMMMQKLQEMKGQQGLSGEEQKLMNQIQQMMEQNKSDIINRNINRGMLNRQDAIFNKLLDLEKAEKSQDFEEKRESKQGSDFQNINHDNLNLKLKDFGVKEYINLSPVNLNLFYQNIYNDYIQNLD